MKNASPHAAKFVKLRRSNGRAIPVSAFFILMSLISAVFLAEPAAAKRMDSALITSIAFNPVNQPPSFKAGIPNPSTQPLRIQTQNVFGTGENVTGAGEAVLITVTTSSTTGRFANSPTGPFNNSAIIVSVTSGRQNSQDIFYLDTAPGTIELTAAVLLPGNTILFGAETSVTKSVSGGGDRLAFSTQPGTVSKDNVMGPPVNVRVQDAGGNLDINSTRNISLSLGNNPTGATLGGTTTVSAVNGIATFTDLRVNKAGTGYTLVANSALPAPALISATSNPFSVSKLSQTIDFDDLDDRKYGDDDFEVYANSSSGAEVSFESLTPESCSVTANVVAIEAAGECSIRASQSGSSDYLAAEPVDRTFLVNKADATVVVEPYDVVFDGQPHTATLVSITGVKGETGSLVGTIDLGGTVHTNAGSYEADTWALIGSRNYNDANGTVGNNIAKASVTAHAGSGSAVYDGARKNAAPCEVSGPGYLGNLTCANNPSLVGPNAGTFPIFAAVSGTGLSNFDITKIDGAFTIEKAPTSISVGFEPGPYVYRGSSFAASAKVSGPDRLDQAIPVAYAGDCLNVSVSDGCVATASFTENGNYLASTGSSRITITKKPLTVAASSHVLTFGAPAPLVSPSFGGLGAGETGSVIDSPPVCSSEYSAGSPVGSYATNCSGGADNNYSFNQPYSSGTVIVNTACSSFDGFHAPVGGSNSPTSSRGGSFNSPLRTFKLNSTIPFKFTAVCFGSALTTGVQTLIAQKYGNGVPVDGEALTYDAEDSKAENQFRYSDGQWHLNFKTKDLGESAQGTWLFEVRLLDGSRYGVWLAIRK